MRLCRGALAHTCASRPDLHDPVASACIFNSLSSGLSMKCERVKLAHGCAPVCGRVEARCAAPWSVHAHTRHGTGSWFTFLDPRPAHAGKLRGRTARRRRRSARSNASSPSPCASALASRATRASCRRRCSRPHCYPRRHPPALAEPSRLAARRANILPRDTEQMPFWSSSRGRVDA